MRFHQVVYQMALTTILLAITIELASALRDVRVRVPHAVRRGEKGILKCFYDIEDDSLYSVKWYKGRREFYRYTPKETPPMKVFHFPGVKVRRVSSNESQVVLDAVTMATSGKYSCEVSADAPSFHTLIAAAELEVIETPHNAPFITGIRSRYRVGDILRGNCTSRHSRPAANLTWTVNNEEVNPSHVRHHKIVVDTRNDMQTSIVGIHFVVTDQHFDNGKLKLRCSAQLHDVYWKTTEKTILEADPFTKYGSGGASGNRVSPDEFYDQYTLHEDEQFHSKKNSYLTQLQGEEDDGAEGAEDGGAAWRGAGSGSSSCCPSQSLAVSGSLLAVLGWTLGRQLVSQLQALTSGASNNSRRCTILRTHSGHMRVSATKQRQRRGQDLQASNCSWRGCTLEKTRGSGSGSSSSCIRQLT
ncbi:uncharacterized protein LOC117584194 isoform X2 [Drosophila guanche]|uniref:Ig-like domain-containing protein n=1 Tax=Drosophila guanche TaxID=7266 RepID=A0A3B0K3E4_DROGU|nr:uncharacterized protein LOC117584194 isoform X2 [Drosophila guanche]SPP82460.1 Hypothetical predicted protein [Drosophila guanche]